MKKTGEILKKSREEKQLSIHEIGLSLKINSKILKAIEEGDAKNLPAKTFLRGFVQSYAQYLKLNPDEILKIFTEEMGSTKPQALPVNVGIEAPLPISAPLTTGKTSSKIDKPLDDDEATVTITSGKQFKTVTLVASVIILLTLILVTKRIIDKYQSEAVSTTKEAPAEPQVTHVAPIEPAVTANNNSSAPAQPGSATEKNSATNPSSPSSVVSTTPTTTTPAANVAPATQTTHSESPATTNTPASSASASNSSATNNQTFVNPATTGPAPKSTLTQQPHSSSSTSTQVPASQTGVATTKTPTTPTTSTAVTAPTAPTKSAATNATPAAAPATSATTSSPTSAADKSQGKSTSQQSASSAATGTNEKATTTETKTAPKNVELIIEAFDVVDIEYSTSNGKNEKMRLEPEQLHTIKTKSGLKLNVSNGGAVNIIVNGKDVGVPGILGKPIKLTF